jgi:hypothetical protein
VPSVPMIGKSRYVACIIHGQTARLLPYSRYAEKKIVREGAARSDHADMVTVLEKY